MSVAVTPLTYESRLNSDPRWALNQGSRHFDEDSEVYRTLRAVTRRLNDLAIPYAVVGGMALFRHGHHRFTDDVDILVTKDGLKRVHEALVGLGYVPLFTGSKNLRDTQTGVKVEFLITGGYPGDGKPKPVAFPDPAEASVVLDGIKYITRPKLVELKLASGMTNIGRAKDIGDVTELIKTAPLPVEFADELDPFVRDKYRELWAAAKTSDLPDEMP